jgi:hypothetical protein
LRIGDQLDKRLGLGYDLVQKARKSLGRRVGLS